MIVKRRLAYIAGDNEQKIALATQIREEAHAELPLRLAWQIDVAIQMHDRDRLRRLASDAGSLAPKIDQLLGEGRPDRGKSPKEKP